MECRRTHPPLKIGSLVRLKNSLDKDAGGYAPLCSIVHILYANFLLCIYIFLVRIFFALMHHYHYYYYKISIALLHFHLRLCSDLHVNCDVAINRRYFTCLDRCVVFVVVCVSKSPFSFLCTIYCTIILLYAPSFIRVLSNVRVPIPDGIVRTASVRFQGWHRA